MAVNLATKYEPKIAQVFTQESVVDGKTNKDYTFTGVRSIHIQTPVTQPLNNYARTGANRYGTPTEMQDTDQELILSRDRSFSITIDKGNLTEQMNIKKSGQMLRAEIREQVTPEMDAYALEKFADKGGKITTLSAAPAADTVVGLLNTGMVYLSNKKVPVDGRTIWIGWSWFGYLRASNQFLGIDSLGARSLTKGTLGTFMGADVVPVPDEYMKKGSSQCYFLIAHKNAVMQPKKIQDYFVKQDPPGINGALLEGRFIYDAFVIGAKADAIYAAVASGTQQAVVTATYTSGTKTMALVSSGATSILYTLDGTDPRYSSSAISVATGADVVLTAYAGTTVTMKSVALDDALFTSDVVTTTQAVAA
jgi:hypothetical protein